MNGHAREDEERGRGVPLTDIERVMRHYNIDEPTARSYLSILTIEELLPERGYGLTQDGIVGRTVDELEAGLQAMDNILPEGGKVQINLCSHQLHTDYELKAFYDEATASGLEVSYPETRIIDGVPTTSLVFTKGAALALLIPIILPLAVMGLITFGIFKLPDITNALMPLLLTVVGGVVVVAIVMRKPAEAAAIRYLARK